MVEVVLDTNVLVAGLRSRNGASFRILQSLGTRRWRPHVSPALALEYEDVLKRPGLVPALTVSDVDDFLNYLSRVAVLMPAVSRRSVVLPDPDDERILEVAVHSGAVIVTHNVRHFAGAERLGVTVQVPSVFLRSLETGL